MGISNNERGIERKEIDRFEGGTENYRQMLRGRGKKGRRGRKERRKKVREQKWNSV